MLETPTGSEPRNATVRGGISWLALRGTEGIDVSSATSDDLERSVIIAMVLVRMMQAALDEIIDVIAVRHGGVAAF